ncbi:RasGEF domain containing protein [Tritrichomonas foetus]|uniref:RasGEF domain containing protein n=1 Tax=Tritrichomonas foetus TaxID=1144522 RepID=A0A1J4KF93_9EUKA|nr:RasGEF domain containing protein [Tritrichomonas foetus]|eukprot:OHT08436.1 RasGEF domain containing protein [Tritrichomonas foetus]
MAKKRKKKSFEFSSAHLSTNNSRSNFKSINFGVDQYVTSPIEKSISVIDPLRIPKEQNMERKNLPYLLSALTILEPLNFSQEEIEKLSHVNTQRFPESSELFLDPDGIILAASFNQLIIFLTHPQASSLDFQQQFLISFPSFTSPTKVLAAIIMRFFANVNYSGCNIANEKELKLIRYRITRIISKWLSLTKYQFTEQMIYAIDIFCQVITTENGLQAQERIIEIAIMSFKGMNNNVTTLTYKSGTPSSCLPHGDASKWKLTKIPPIETARQITLLHSQIFRSIKPTEILAVIWGDKKSGGSPNITKLIQHFNAFSNVVMLTVLFPKKSKKRALVHAHWVAVAYHCYEIHNFHAMFSIVFGLTHPSIERLSKTVARSAKICGKKFVFSNMKELCKFDNDYHNYREMIANTMEPCVPFIGCIQKDLIYVQESFQNTIYDLINFKKCIECVSLLQKITRFQNERYNFELSEKIQTLITNIPLETDNVILMKLSMSREVRNMKK